MANEPAAGEQKVGVKIISSNAWQIQRKTRATRNKATQLDHQELFRHVVGVVQRHAVYRRREI